MKECHGSIWIAAIVAALLGETGTVVADEGTIGESQFITKARALTYEGNRSGEGYFSPDGKYLIFQSEREADNPFYQIYVLSFETGDAHRVSTGVGKTTCSFFHPNGNAVLFASTHLDPRAKEKQKEEIEFRASGKERRYSWDYDEHYDIFSSNLDGTGLTRLTDTPGYDAECSYSPGGDAIVFCSNRVAYAGELDKDDRNRLEIDPAYFAEIYVMDADGQNQVRLTDWPGYDGGPFFSPDGKRILWRHFDESGMLADIYSMRVDGSDRRQLTDFESMNWAPYYHPSGDYIVFTSNKQGFSNFELYIVDAAGAHDPVRVTFTDGFDGLPTFSPDGMQITWTSNRVRDKKSQIFLADWNDAAARAALGLASAGEGASAGRSPEIRAGDMRADVEYLASDELEGRMTGREGERLAGEYIAGRLEDIGLDPLGDDETYFQEFPFTSGVELIRGGNTLLVSGASDDGDITFEVDEDFRPLAFTTNGEVEGPVVFAGYGLTTPGEGVPYDSYAGLDVEGKIVLVMRYVPEDVETERRQQLNRHAGLRYKAMLARENGAKALLVVSGPNSPNAGKLVPLRFDQNLANSGIVVASVSGKVAEALFAGADKTLKDVQSGLDEENPHVEGAFELPEVRVKVKTAVRRETDSAQNVVAVLRPSDGDSGEFVVIGAHYDHIGHGEIGSLAGKDEAGQVHNGADDNASGTSMVLDLAAALADARRRDPTALHRGIIVGLWSGEELGIIGSSFFVEHPPVPLEQIVAYVNFDMVGRLRDNRLMIQGVNSSNMWTGLIERKNVPAGFDLVLQDDPYLPTDVTAFYPKEIPVISFFTGIHDDYNRPSDDPETLNYDGMERIASFALALISDVAGDVDRPDYVKVERSKEPKGERASLRAYLGTIPDYAADDIEGVKLSGVRAGGPADKAGLQEGDIIVEFGGQKITNIYDYTYALDAVKIGEATDVVVLRGDQRVTLTVVPEARE